jgi:hypothetical protein
MGVPMVIGGVNGPLGLNPFGIQPSDDEKKVSPNLKGAGNLSGAAPALDARVQAALAFLNFLGPPVLTAPRVPAGGKSAEEVIHEAQQNRKERAEAEIGQEAVKPQGLHLKPLEDAAKTYAADIGDATVRWAQKNSSSALAFGVQLLRTAVAAVATGGTSLAVDGPKLAATGLAIASGIAAEAGLNLDKVVGDFASAALQSLGVDKSAAEKWGRTIASLSGAAIELTMAYTSGGTYKVDVSKFGNLASDFAAAVGADKATAAMVAATATGLATVGLAIAGGGDLASKASFTEFMTSAQSLAGKVAQGLLAGEVNVPEMLKDGTAAYADFQKLLADFQADTGVQDFWKNAGPLFEKLAQSALSSLVGLVSPQQSLQA